MANEDLKRQRDDFQRQLSDIQRENKIIEAEILAIIAAITKASTDISNYENVVSNRLNDVDSSIHHSHQTLINSIEIEKDIEEMYGRFKNMETANKTLRDLKDKETREFDVYNKARKLVCGMMENLTVKFVDDEIIHKAIEITRLENQNFWLTCCLLAVMAWRNNDKTQANKAIKQALALDKKSSSLFFMIFYMRLDREEIALKWFQVFKKCEYIGQDSRAFLMLFSLLDETLQKDVEDETKEEVRKFIQTILDDNKKASNYSEGEAIEHIKNWWAKSQPSKDLNLSYLEKHVEDIQTMHDILMKAFNNVYILDFVKKLSNISVEERNDFLNKYIVELINLPCDDEKTVEKETRQNELILDYEGRVDEANAAYVEETARNENALNFILEMIDWIYDVDNPDVNDQIRLNLYRLTKDIQSKAYNEYYDEYKKQYTEKHYVDIEDYHTNVDFNNLENENNKIDEYYNGKVQEESASIKTWPTFIGLGVAVAAGVGCFFAGFWLLFFTICGCLFAGGWISWVMLKKFQIKRRYSKIAENCKETMKKLFDDFAEYRDRFIKHDNYSDEIKKLIEAV